MANTESGASGWTQYTIAAPATANLRMEDWSPPLNNVRQYKWYPNICALASLRMAVKCNRGF